MCGDSGGDVASEQTPDELLEAGELSLRLVGGDVRSATWRGTELLQRAYFAVRDAPWNTVPGVIEERSIERRPDGFSALIRQRHHYEDIDLRAELSVAGQADGTLVIGATTVAESSFSYSKIGLNLHHGLRTYRGATGRARTLDGWVTFSLNDEIEPQLIRDGTLTAMFAHFDALEVDLPAVAVRFDFEGDRFEMQDHRNWCDANWKTYGTPLEYGFPMDCAAEQRFEQTVTISVSDVSDSPPAFDRPPRRRHRRRGDRPRPGGRLAAVDRRRRIGGAAAGRDARDRPAGVPARHGRRRHDGC